MTWPPRWTGPQFKTGVSSKIEQAKTRREHKAHELREKQIVRIRDRTCRFPLCGCKKLKLRLEVSHLKHKGMGGNPKGDRSQAHLMILVCVARHRQNQYAIDKGTIECRPLSPSLGTNGPVAWWMAGENGQWHLLAAEQAKLASRSYEPMTGWQSAQLRLLAEMHS